jgi:hypothetical protein
MLLIEYLENAAADLREKKVRLRKLDEQYRRAWDRDIKKEMAIVRKDIAKKSSEVTSELLLNLEEFRALHKYFPALVQAYMEDEYIGRVVQKKAWLLGYRQLPPKQAAARLNELRAMRAQLRDAKQFLRRWTGTLNARAFIATYPILAGRLAGIVDKADALAAIAETDKALVREGWLVLISDSLIRIPAAMFMTKISALRNEEAAATADMGRARGRGTVTETVALRKYQEVVRKKEHYEHVLAQLFLANPNYLRAQKTRKNWLAREKAGNMDKFVQSITPHTIKERVWLNEMRRLLDEK